MLSAVGSVTCVPRTLGILQGRWALGVAGASPRPRRGPRRPDNPASSSLPATGLLLVGPAGPLPQPCLGTEPRVGSRAGGQGREPGMVSRSAHQRFGPSASEPVAARPSIRPSIPAPLLRRRCFPLPVFFPALAPPRAAWSGEVVGPPRRLVCSSSTTTSPFRPSESFKKSFDSHVNLGGAQEICIPSPPGFYSLLGRIPTLPLWDLGVPSRAPPS